MEKPETLETEYQTPAPVETVDGLHCNLDRAGLEAFVEKYGLAMDADDCGLLSGLFPRGRPGAHHYGNADAGYLLVRPLPPHHLPHQHRRGLLRRRHRTGGL